MKMIKYTFLCFCILLSVRSLNSEGLCSDSNLSANCSEFCLTLVTNSTYRQILFDEIRFLKILLQRLTSAGLTSIKPEHINRTLLLASSPDIETGTLEFTRQHLLNAILENPAARNELEYVYVSRQDIFPKIVNEIRNTLRRFEEKVRLETSGSGSTTDINWELLIKMFNECKNTESVDKNYIRAEVAVFMNFERWTAIAVNFHDDFKTNKFCSH